MSEFAANLKQFRKRKKYSQATLARKLNYGHMTIANYESGRNEPSIDDLIKIAIILDISFIFRFNQLETKHKKIILDLIQALIEQNTL